MVLCCWMGYGRSYCASRPRSSAASLRVVCRLWQSITSNPGFIAAHMARHPLLVGRFESSGNILVLDLSGNVIRQIQDMRYGLVLPTCLDLVCAANTFVHKANVLNPATGAVHALPENMWLANIKGFAYDVYESSFTFGKVPMGEYKVICIVTAYPLRKQILEVLTLSSSSPMHWRAKQAPPVYVRPGELHSVVVKGVVYFLLQDGFNGSTMMLLSQTAWPYSTSTPRNGYHRTFKAQ